MIEHYSDHAANERTFLAWIRTAIAVMAFGFLVERFDLFLQIAGQTLARKALSPTGQLVGNVAGLILIALGASDDRAGDLAFPPHRHRHRQPRHPARTGRTHRLFARRPSDRARIGAVCLSRLYRHQPAVVSFGAYARLHFPAPRQRGGGRGADRGGRGAIKHRTPPPPCFAWSPSPAPFHFAGTDKRTPFSQRILRARVLLTATKPRKIRASTKGKRSADRRIVLPMSASSAACARFICAPTFRRSRSRHSPPASTPMPQPRTGFPAAAADRCFAGFAKKCRG